jgi:hypothetical protein
LEDLSAINYRYQGLANKNPETQQIVLVKRIKLGVRSVKVPWVDLDLKNLIFPGGFQGKVQDSSNSI